MQTFIPYQMHTLTAMALDRQRLGKQRVECKQILLALSGESDGWVNHPAVQMWRGHERFLSHYGLTVCREWRSRGYHDKLAHQLLVLGSRFAPSSAGPPPWWGRGDVHASHRAQLLRKSRAHYQVTLGLTNDEVDALMTTYPGYVWPV